MGSCSNDINLGYIATSRFFCANTSVLLPGASLTRFASTIDELVAALVAAGGRGCLTLETARRELYSQDIWCAAPHLTAAVVTPESTAQLSQADAACAAIEALFEECASECQGMGVQHGFLYTTLSTNAFLIEPVFFWPDAHMAIHRATVEANLLARMPTPEANAAATELVRRLRRRVIEIFESFSAAHFQIGRTYGYRRSRDAASLELWDAIKHILDPEHVMNPGTLEQE
jgi:FAD/FMN-containing dehydrogenase